MVAAISIGFERHRGSRVTEGAVLLRQPSPHANRPIRATCVDAPLGARRIVVLGAARRRVLTCVRPLMRRVSCRGPGWEMLWGERRGGGIIVARQDQRSAPMPQLNDQSRSPTVLKPDSPLIAVLEMSQSAWLVAGLVPGIERHPLKKIEPDEAALLRLLRRWQEEATQAGHPVPSEGVWSRRAVSWPGGPARWEQ